jgi:hypothetical protein
MSKIWNSLGYVYHLTFAGCVKHLAVNVIQLHDWDEGNVICHISSVSASHSVRLNY